MLITNLNIKTYSDIRVKQCAAIKKYTKPVKCIPAKSNRYNNKYSNNTNKTRKKK